MINDELSRLLVIEERLKAFLKVDSCNIHKCGKSREQRKALEETIMDGFVTSYNEKELREASKAWIAGKGPMPNPFAYASVEGRKVGSFNYKAELSYEEFWAQAELFKALKEV